MEQKKLKRVTTKKFTAIYQIQRKFYFENDRNTNFFINLSEATLN